jgi:tRNA dimethylallyltransferase
LIVLFGPTGLGKTDVAVSLAEQLGAEIVSADSMQVYRGVPVLTNQPTAEQLARVPHHLVAVIPADHEFSVAEYAQRAQAAIDDILARGRYVVVEGGAGLYVRAALGGLVFGAPPDPELRRALEARAAGDFAALRADLARLDAATATHIDLDNPRRVIRALETILSQGGPLTSPQRDKLWTTGERYDHVVYALTPDRDELRARVDARVEQMVAAGLVDEIARLRSLAFVARTLQQAIGVREIWSHLDGHTTLDEAVVALQTRTRRYVRRQLTWMRKLPDAVTIATAGRSPGAVTDAIVEHFRQVTVGGATVDASAFPALGEKSIIGDLSAASP